MSTTYTPGQQDNEMGNVLVALGWSLFATAFVVVALRIWTRVAFLKDRLALHDWLMICAIISEIVHVALLTAGRNAGLGRHIETLTGEQISHSGHYISILKSFSITTSYFGRMSFSAFLLSVLGGTAPVQRWVLWGIIISNTLINIICVIQAYAQCGINMSALWDPAVAAIAHCSAAHVEKEIGFTQAAMNSFCDFVLTIVPLTIVRKLQLPAGTKAALGALLCLSLFALVASIAKAVEIRDLSGSADFTYHFAILQLTVIIENDVVMIAASMPMLRALWIREGGASSKSNGGQYPSGGNSRMNQTGRSQKATNKSETDPSIRDDDEEHILASLPRGGIQRTTEMDIEHSYHGDVKDDADVSVQAVSWR